MRALGIIVIVCAIAVAGISQTFNCQAEGKYMKTASGMNAPMRCFYTAEAALATSGTLLVVGGFMLFAKRKENQRTLAGIGSVLGAFTILLPTALIGVCTTMTADCNQIVQPALILLGAVVTVGCLGSLVLIQRQQEQLA